MKKINFYIVSLALLIISAILFFFDCFELRAWKGMNKIILDYNAYEAFLCIGSDSTSVEFGGIVFSLLFIFSIVSYIYIIIKRKKNSLLSKINLYLIAMIFAIFIFSSTGLVGNFHPEASLYKQLYEIEKWNTNYELTACGIIISILLILSFTATCIEVYKNRKK